MKDNCPSVSPGVLERDDSKRETRKRKNWRRSSKHSWYKDAVSLTLQMRGSVLVMAAGQRRHSMIGKLTYTRTCLPTLSVSLRRADPRRRSRLRSPQRCWQRRQRQPPKPQQL